MRQNFINILVSTVVTAVMLVGVEVLFRFNPSLIGVSVIERMHPMLRSRIAAQLKLPTLVDYDVISSTERSDHGPDLYLMKPSHTYFRPADEVDRIEGAIETTTTDHRGFCNPSEAEALTSFDIVTVGGSVPNCAMVGGEEVFSNHLGRIVLAPSYNLTVDAVGPYEYNEVIKRYVDDLDPQVVVYAISESNDLRDCVRYLDFAEGKTGDRHNKLGGPFRVSYLLAFVKASVEVLYRDFAAKFSANFRYSVKVRGSIVKMNVTNGDLDELKSAKKLRDGVIKPDLYSAPLKKFVELARQKHFKPLVMYVPATYTVYGKSIEFEDESIGSLLPSYSRTQRDWLATNATRMGYEFFDPTEFLQERALASPLLYFPSDLHLTPEGQKALAEAIAPSISKILGNH